MGQMSPMPSFLIRTYWDPQVFVIKYSTLVMFNKVSFDGRNARASSLAGITREKDKSPEM